MRNFWQTFIKSIHRIQSNLKVLEMIMCSPMIGQFFDTLIVTSSGEEWL